MNNQQSQSPQQQQQISLQDLHNNQNQNQHHFMNPPSDDFLEQMLSSLGPPPPSSWPAAADDEDHSSFAPFELDPLNLASKFRAHQIGPRPTHLMLHHLPAPLTLDHNDAVDPSPFKSPGSRDGPVQGLFNGFGSGSLPSPNQFHPPQAHQNYAGPSPAVNQTPAPSGSSGGAQPRPRVRARRGQATDPHSIAERLRRERIAERMKALQELVPNGNKTDKASMLDEIIDYVKFLQLQVKVLSMSRLGGAAAVAPLFADMSSEGGGDCIQTNTNGGGVHRRASSNGGNNNQNGSSNDTMTVTEHQVAKLMEEDMGSAMQYLQGKGLCLMPISLATAISTATCHSRNPLINNANPLMGGGGGSFNGGGGEGPTSPNMSVLTVQSATAGNGVADGTIKDSASVSKP